jgi:hypothetical protein
LRADVEALLLKMESKHPPELDRVHAWLKVQELTDEEYIAIETVIAAIYGADTPEEVLQMMEPGLGEYVDDFSEVLDDHEIKGFLRDYVEHTRGMEAPTPFHFGVALALLGATLRRRVWVDQGYYKVWPAIQILLVGPSGKVKKSTSASYGVAIVTELFENPPFNVLPDEGSGEALKTELAQLTKRTGEASGLLYVSELATFLGKQEYNVNLVQTLTDLFDSRASKRRRTQARGNERMENIALTFIGCSNEDWLGDALPHSAFGGGFFGRMLVFYQPDTDRHVSRPVPPTAEARESLVASLSEARFVAGEAVLTAGADREFDRIYREVKRDWPEDERLVPFWERFGDHVLRLAMLISVSRNTGQTEGVQIDTEDIKSAEAVVRWVIKYLPGVYESVGTTQYGRDHARIYQYILRAGGTLEEKKLSRKMSKYLPKRELEAHLDHMKYTGVIKRVRLDAWEGSYGWKVVKRL